MLLLSDNRLHFLSTYHLTRSSVRCDGFSPQLSSSCTPLNGKYACLPSLNRTHFSLVRSGFPQLRRQSHPPQQLRLFVAQNRPFSHFFRSCQVIRCKMGASLQHNPPLLQQPTGLLHCFVFYSELSFANLVARLAALHHKTTFSATKSVHLSRVVAVSDHFCQRRRCRHNKKREPVSRFVLSLLITHYSLLITSFVLFPCQLTQRGVNIGEATRIAIWGQRIYAISRIGAHRLQRG